MNDSLVQNTSGPGAEDSAFMQTKSSIDSSERGVSREEVLRDREKALKVKDECWDIFMPQRLPARIREWKGE